MNNFTVPKYVKRLLQGSILLDEPYRIKVFSNNKVGGEKGFLKEIDKFLEWCKRWYADATIIEDGMWYKKYPTAQSAYNNHHHNYFVLEITDPVMLKLEKEGIVK